MNTKYANHEKPQLFPMDVVESTLGEITKMGVFGQNKKIKAPI